MTTKTSAPETEIQIAELDLAEYDKLQQRQDEGIEVPIKDPAGKSLGFSIRIAGPDSKLQRKAMRILVDERLEDEVIQSLPESEQELREVRGLALSTMGWTSFKLDGAEYRFTVENAQKLYTRFPFIRSQVEFRAERRAAFLPD